MRIVYKYPKLGYTHDPDLSITLEWRLSQWLRRWAYVARSRNDVSDVADSTATPIVQDNAGRRKLCLPPALKGAHVCGVSSHFSCKPLVHFPPPKLFSARPLFRLTLSRLRVINYVC